MEEEVIPILGGADVARAVAWYERLGVKQEWLHRFGPEFPAFVSIARGRARLFLSEHQGDAQPDTLIYLRSDIDAVAKVFDAGVEEPPRVRECHLTDPGGNRLRIGTPTD
jgi:hypothetical protein